MLTNQVLLPIGMCFVLIGLITGMLLCLLIWRLTLPGKVYALKKKPMLSLSSSDVRRTLGCLQQLQAMMGQEAAKDDPGLSDVAAFIRSMRQQFGYDASLEGVIQALVSQDLAQQVSQRQHRSTRRIEAIASVERQGVAV